MNTAAAPHDGANGPDASITPAAAREAVQWFLDLQAPGPAPRLREDWLRWRAASPVHERAWQRIECVGRTLQGGASPFASAVAQAKLAGEAARGRRRAVQALAVLAFGAGGAWAVHQRTPWREAVADHRTAVGERRVVTLPDGTRVELNTASAIDVRYGAAERRLVLVAGEILVTTARDGRPAPRPFLVETAQGEVRALGTRFTVRQGAQDARVAVYDGAVEIRPRSPGAPALRLQAGQQARFGATDVSAPGPAAQADTAWTRGALVALSMRLDDFLAELGRYSGTPLACDPAVAHLRVSGSYPTDDVAKALEALSAVLGLEVRTVTRFWGRQAVRIELAPRTPPG